MKKISLSLLSIVVAINFSYAQWATISGNTTTSDKIGIGTTSPSSDLQIRESSDSKPGGTVAPTISVLKLSRAGTANYAYPESAEFRIGHGGPSYWGTQVDLFVNGSSNQNDIPDQQAMTWLYNGYVGIGTASPKYNFHINKSTATLALDGITGGLGNSGAVIDLLGWAATNKNWQIGVANIGPGGLNFTSSTAAGGSTFTTPLMTIADNGNVGIGTTNPGLATKLQVAGVGLFTGGSPDPGDGTPAGVSVGYYSTGNYGFIQSMVTGVAYRPLILQPQGGNIGIGTGDPQGYKLAVKGTIHSQEVVVDMSFLPDYVFKPTYHLPTLTDVKTYIDQNHHLPDMPSAEQVAKDGLSLGDMNARLLKKVEELTLYLIEKDKQVTNLQTEVDELKKQISTLIKSKP